MPPPLPTPFYNACYFPYLTSEGKSLWEQLAQVNFKPSYCNNAIINILKWLQMANLTRIFEIHPLEMDTQLFQVSLILDSEGTFVSAFREKLEFSLSQLFQVSLQICRRLLIIRKRLDDTCKILLAQSFSFDLNFWSSQ
jgi:hypothetical protein